MGDEQKEEPTSWADELRRCLANLETATATASQLEHWLWQNVVANDVWPRAMPTDLAELLSKLHGSLEDARNVERQLFERLCSRPSSKLLLGQSLTPEEYYLLLAMGVIASTTSALGLAGIDDYQAFRMLYYEDESRHAIINPALRPRQPGDTVGMRFGIPPEEVKASSLSPDQRIFFQSQLPDVWARFIA